MRILMLTNLYPTEKSPWGGVFVESRVEALRSAGHHVDCRAVVPVRTGALRLLAQLRGADPRGHNALEQTSTIFQPLYVKMTTWGAMRVHRGLVSQATVQSAARLLAGDVELESYDLVVAHGMFGVPAGAVASAAVGAGRFTVVCHGSDINVLMERNQTEYARVFDDARSVLFVSAALASRARELGMKAKQVGIVPNGVDLDRFPPSRRNAARARLGLSPGDDVVAFVGALTRVKGADRLPAVVDELRRLVPDVQVLIAGDGVLLQELRKELGPRAHILGRLSSGEVADAMAASDAVVLPSRSEGWPTVIQEAHASGVAVAGTDVGGIPEALTSLDVVVGGGPDLERRLARALAALLRSTGEQRASLRLHAEGFSWDSIVERELREMLGDPA